MKTDPIAAGPARPRVRRRPVFRRRFGRCKRFGETGRRPNLAASFLCFAVCALLWAATPIRPALPSGDRLFVGRFSAAPPTAALPAGWEPLTFRNIPSRTEYKLVDDDGTTVIRAESRSSASGLIRKIAIDLKHWPVLSWRWRVSNVYKKGDLSKKAGDDYPARIYVAFRYDPERAGFFERLRNEAVKALYGEYPPASVINYIWANRAPEETAVPNPYSDRALMVALESGGKAAGRWVSEKRNVLEDYRRLYGEDPPMVSGVAIMTDSDNTGESAVAWYGDIVFYRR